MPSDADMLLGSLVCLALYTIGALVAILLWPLTIVTVVAPMMGPSQGDWGTV